MPFLAGFSGFHSKDSIVEQALSHWQSQLGAPASPGCSSSCRVCGAAITAFYMFRLWYMTFAGEPRDHHRYDHAHESPQVMTGPLVLLAVFAVCAGWISRLGQASANFGVTNLLEQARPVGTLATTTGVLHPGPDRAERALRHAEWHDQGAGGHRRRSRRRCSAFVLATMVYLLANRRAPRRSPQTLRPLYQLSWHKWWFDELYDFVFVRPTLAIGAFVAAVLDRGLIDGIIHALASIGHRLRGRRLRRRRPVRHRQRRRHVRREDLGPGPVAAHGADRPAAAVRDVYRGRYGRDVSDCQRVEICRCRISKPGPRTARLAAPLTPEP